MTSNIFTLISKGKAFSFTESLRVLHSTLYVYKEQLYESNLFYGVAFEFLTRAVTDRELDGMSISGLTWKPVKSMKRRLTARIAQHHDCFIVLTRTVCEGFLLHRGCCCCSLPPLPRRLRSRLPSLSSFSYRPRSRWLSFLFAASTSILWCSNTS